MNRDIKPGDWVRFYSAGELVVGVVEYVRRNVLGDEEICTDIGCIMPTSVLEVRPRAS